jgi:catechol 2,3-dioxygenase-like lactoylglutathione lyase family enzyme
MRVEQLHNIEEDPMVQQIPIFYCKSLDVTLGFYEALGFEVTYRQAKPYLYAAVNCGQVNLHFSTRAKNASCLVFVPDVSAYHEAFADALRTHYGRVPTAGAPRLTRLRPWHTRFRLVDPGGNELVYINQDEPDADYDAYEATLSPLAEALDRAVFLRDTYTEDKAAARVLDLALARYPLDGGNSVDRARALAARAELAVALEDIERAQVMRDELAQIVLSDEERVRFSEELEASAVLERWITEAG